MTVELPQPRRQPRPAGDGRPSPSGWSPADELAALETVWASLCQDAASAVVTVQLPDISRAGLSRDVDRRSLRQLRRRRRDSGRIAS